jgi:hypothetical protein
MKIHGKKIIFFSLLFIANIYPTHPYISIRSQSVDAARDLVGWTDKINLYDMENLYITGAVTLEGTSSFNAQEITRCLFGRFDCAQDCSSECNDHSPSITVSGSRVPNRGPNDWLADYFGLSTTFESKLFFKPHISNLLVDFNVYLGLDEWVSGLYFRAHAPIVSTRWDLNFVEKPVNNGLTLLGYDAGYFSPSAVPLNALVPDAESFFSDGDVPTLTSVTFEPLGFSRFERTRQTKTALAEIQMVLGYNFFQNDNYHFGLNLRVYAPTGNRPDAFLLFQPIVGNGKHWEVGGGLSTHYAFWQSECNESSFGVYLDANFTHLFKAHQRRTFDLKGKPNSRYMLAERMGTKVLNLFAHPNPGVVANATIPSAQFQSFFTPVANLTSLKVNVSNAVQSDVVLLFNYYYCGLSFDVGYNLWAISCEKITQRCECVNRFDTDLWALKGDSQAFGFDAASLATSIPLSATQTGAANNNGGATINSGTNNFIDQNPNDGGIGGIRPTRNPGVDNPAFAQTAPPPIGNDSEIVDRNDGTGLQMETSLNPVLFSLADVDFEGARTKGFSNKVFAHFSYTWTDCDDILPYIGIGAKAEFGPRHHENNCNSSNCNQSNQVRQTIVNSCTGCERCNISEWGVWVKGGVFFN